MGTRDDGDGSPLTRNSVMRDPNWRLAKDFPGAPCEGFAKVDNRGKGMPQLVPCEKCVAIEVEPNNG